MTLNNKILSSRYPQRRRFAWWKRCSIIFFLHCMLLQYLFIKQKKINIVYTSYRMRGSRKQFGKEVSNWEFCFPRLVGGGVSGQFREFNYVILLIWIFPGEGSIRHIRSWMGMIFLMDKNNQLYQTYVFTLTLH